MTTKVALSAEARELAALVADAIESQGHWQGTAANREQGADWDNGGPCCIVANPAYQEADFKRVAQPFYRHLGDVVEGGVYKWNDTTPTDEVLATLRSISRGEL